MKRVIIWGASGHAKVIMGALNGSDFEILAFIDLNINITKLDKYDVYSSVEQLFEKKNFWLSNEELFFIVAIGGDRGKERIEIHEKLVSMGLKPATVVHPYAWIDLSAEIGEGSQILGMAAISAEVKIGKQTIVNTNATIDHETVISDGCHIMPAATIAGCVIIEKFCTIGSNATILPRVKLKMSTTVGAGAVVTKDTVENSIVVGIPAKQI